MFAELEPQGLKTMLSLLLVAVGTVWAPYFKKQENPYIHCNMQLLQLVLKASLEVLSLSLIRGG